VRILQQGLHESIVCGQAFGVRIGTHEPQRGAPHVAAR
jgi:hypothetical protein